MFSEVATNEVKTTGRHSVDKKATIGGVAVVAILSVLVVLSHTLGFVTDGAGTAIGVVAPALWASGALYLVFLFTAAAVLLDVATNKRGPTIELAAANAALSLLFIVPVIWLASTGGLLNDAFFVAVGWPAGTSVMTLTLVGLAALMAAQGTISGFRRASL